MSEFLFPAMDNPSTHPKVGSLPIAMADRAAIPVQPAMAPSSRILRAASSPGSASSSAARPITTPNTQAYLPFSTWANENGTKRLRVVSDSELMVKQMKGQYKVASPGLRPLWEEAKRLAGRLERFEMRHTLRGGNQEADRLANEAMDQGMGKTSKEQSGPQVTANAGVAHGTAKPANPPKPPPQTLDGYVKGGVVHLLEGDLPDGTFVKVIRQ